MECLIGQVKRSPFNSILLAIFLADCNVRLFHESILDSYLVS